jgi:hypothetical protein
MRYAEQGKITRVYPDQGDVYFRLNGLTGSAPKDGYYRLLLTHPNYNALYSLTLAAAVNGTTVTIRTDYDFTPNAHGIVNYIMDEF